ncbi:MAG: hypothetical protein ACREID_06425 [Planctomycetota bacterium]
MPADAVPRALLYVAWIFALTLATALPWWAAARAARAEYRGLFSALACSMRMFAYSVSLLVLLVVLQSLGVAPQDPRSPRLGWIHLAGTALLSFPCAWRSFRAKGLRLAGVVAIGWALCGAAGFLAYSLHGGFRAELEKLPRLLARAT